MQPVIGGCVLIVVLTSQRIIAGDVVAVITAGTGRRLHAGVGSGHGHRFGYRNGNSQRQASVGRCVFGGIQQTGGTLASNELNTVLERLDMFAQGRRIRVAFLAAGHLAHIRLFHGVCACVLKAIR